MPPPITILSHDAFTRRQLGCALSSGGLEARFVERTGDFAKLAEDTGSGETFIGLMDVDSLGIADLVNLLPELFTPREGSPRPQLLLLCNAPDRTLLSELMKEYSLMQLLAKHATKSNGEPALDEREMLVTCRKLVEGDIFGLEKYVGGWGTAIHRTRLTSMADKYRLLHDFEAFLTDLGMPTTVVPDVLTVADELMLNAIVHAPHDPNGTPRYEHLEPDPKLVLRPNENVDVAFACDGARLMFSVSDNFGALKRSTLQNYLGKALTPQKRQVESKASGAGLGLSMAFLNTHQLVFNIHEKHRTEVIAGWHVRLESATVFRQTARSANVFWVGQNERVQRAPQPAPLPNSSMAASSVPVTLRHLRGRVGESSSFLLTPDVRQLDMRNVGGFSARGVGVWRNFLSSLGDETVELFGVPDAMVLLARDLGGLFHRTRVSTVVTSFECATCHNRSELELAPAQVLLDDAGICQPCGGPLRYAGDRRDFEAFLEQLVDD